jgi:hypothetical protein
MDYKKLAELSYKIFRPASKWEVRDRIRINKIAELLQTEIEKELANAGIVAADENNSDVPASISRIVEEQPVVQSAPRSLMERIFTEQDEAIDLVVKTDVSYTVVPEIVRPKAQVKANVATTEQRYFITIICNGLIKKPSFQIFKGEDIIEKDFKTDAVTMHNNVYYAVVDGLLEDIREVVRESFVSAYVSTYTENGFDYVPAQYKTIWQDRTKIIK